MLALGKASKQEREKKTKEEQPFQELEGGKRVKPKMSIPTNLWHGQELEGGEHMSTRRVRHHDEQDHIERFELEKVRKFVSHVRWQPRPSSDGGITWIELYILYNIHGAGEVAQNRRRADPLMKQT